VAATSQYLLNIVNIIGGKVQLGGEEGSEFPGLSLVWGSRVLFVGERGKVIIVCYFFF
jgi:hypothetical protein